MDEKSDYDQESRQVERIGGYSLLINLLLTAIKALLTLYSGSIAIQASTVDSATDSVASMASWIGLKLSSRKTRKFPYGLYKIENMIQVGMALLILMVGYEIVKDILFESAQPPQITPWVIAGMAVSVLIPLLFGQYEITAGKRTGSPALVADGKHRRADVMSSLAVLVAIVAGYVGIDFNWYGVTPDKIAAVIVLVFIAATGIEILVSGMRVLLDASLGDEQISKIRDIISSYPSVIKIKSISGRSAGRFRFVEAAVSLRTSELKKAHTIIDRIENDIREKISRIDKLLIHYEPEEKPEVVVAVPLQSDQDRICDHFGEAPLFYIGVVRKFDGRVLDESLAHNPYSQEGKGKGLKVAKWLLTKRIDHVYTLQNLADKSPGYVLSDAGVEISVVDDVSLAQLRSRWKENHL